MHKYSRFFFVVSILVLSGCSDVRSTLGLERSSPDEFSVVTRAPLSLPPSYDLRPPHAGEPRPQEQTTKQQAEQTLFGRKDSGSVTSVPVGSYSSAEQGFLAKAGATTANPNIRAVLDKETAKKPDADKGVIETLEDFSVVKKVDPLVDPAAESKRIRSNQKAGELFTTGDVKQQEPQQKTLWDRLGL
jgi:hypothetical protein